jgi:hypothetical protein
MQAKIFSEPYSARFFNLIPVNASRLAAGGFNIETNNVFAEFAEIYSHGAI